MLQSKKLPGEGRLSAWDTAHAGPHGGAICIFSKSNNKREKKDDFGFLVNSTANMTQTLLGDWKGDSLGVGKRGNV